MKIYRAGIIGTGFIGAVHIETLRRLGNVEVAALTDTVEQVFRTIQTFSSVCK